jgi:hypothetical protein
MNWIVITEVMGNGRGASPWMSVSAGVTSWSVPDVPAALRLSKPWRDRKVQKFPDRSDATTRPVVQGKNTWNAAPGSTLPSLVLMKGAGAGGGW